MADAYLNDTSQDVRTLNQNALIHAVCGEIGKQRLWAGYRLDAEGWKRLCVDAWARETGRSPGQIVPSLEGYSVVVLNISTRKLGKKDFAELMDWIFAYCDMEGLRIKASDYYNDWAEQYRGK